jgi:hypothetical protein
MPLPEKSNPPEDDGETRVRPFAPLSGLAEAAFDYFEQAAELVLDPIGLQLPKKQETPRVGEFLVDYSALTPDEIAETDSECTDLFGRSQRISR